jgi:hypothetical protein
VCTGQPGQPSVCGPGEVGAVTNGWQYNFVVMFFLPLTAGNAYQGGTATVQLTAHAVDASHNPLSVTCPSVSDPFNFYPVLKTFTYLGHTYTYMAFWYPEPDQPGYGWNQAPGTGSCPSLTAFWHPYT